MCRWRREGGVGAKLYDGEKDWSSINHLILSGGEKWGGGVPPSLLSMSGTDSCVLALAVSGCERYPRVTVCLSCD